MYNIKQKTRVDVDEETTIGGITYYIHNLGTAYKLGFIGNPPIIGLPLILTTSQGEVTVYVGKTGMYELQPEMFKNVNDDESEEEEVVITISKIQVPIPKDKNGNDMGIEEFTYIIDYAVAL